MNEILARCRLQSSSIEWNSLNSCWLIQSVCYLVSIATFKTFLFTPDADNIQIQPPNGMDLQLDLSWLLLIWIENKRRIFQKSTLLFLCPELISWSCNVEPIFLISLTFLPPAKVSMTWLILPPTVFAASYSGLE